MTPSAGRGNGNQRITTRVAGQVYYIHGDHLGSTTLLTDESGAEVSRVQYAPYGSIIEQSGALPTDRLFTGQRREESLGLYDSRARFYDPLTSNFLSPDTVVPGALAPAGRYRRHRHQPGCGRQRKGCEDWRLGHAKN